jgi:hypothetical protein
MLRISLYANNAVVSLKQEGADISLITNLLKLFGRASGLHTNIQKSSVAPIRCDLQTINAAKELLPYEFVVFPCRYLVMLLSIK